MSSFVKEAAIYTITDGISKGLSFLILPLVSFYLVPSELGIATNFDVLQNVLSLLAGMAVVNGLPFFYYKRTKEQVAILISNLLYIIFFLSISFSFIILLVFPIIEHYIYLSLSLQLLSVVSVLALLSSSINFIIYRLENEPYKFAKLQILQSVLHASLIVFFVIVLKFGAIGKILGSVVPLFIMAAINLYLLWKRGYLVIRYEKKIIKELLHFGIPLLPHSLSFWIKGGMDKVLLTTFCGLYYNGLYSMASSFAGLYSLFFMAFSNAYVPYLQKRLNNMTPSNVESEKRSIVRQQYLLMIGFLALSVVVIGICWVLINTILDDHYNASFIFIPYLLIAQAINSICGLVIQFPYTVKKTLGMGIITFSGSIIQLFLTYLLISTMGVTGLNISIIVGSAIIAIGVWIYSNKVYPMPWGYFLHNN